MESKHQSRGLEVSIRSFEATQSGIEADLRLLGLAQKLIPWHMWFSDAAHRARKTSKLPHLSHKQAPGRNGFEDQETAHL